MDPLDDQLWGLRMVRSDQARKVQAGRKGVTVGVLDTGIDATQPDLAPNFSWDLSRNFARDLPDVDGACEAESCIDPVGTDDGGHGTHVAGTVAAAANGFGISGVAPNVTLVELKGGQDSGYFFTGPVTSALTYAADAGIDVVNMSFYVDPWLYNCPDNPADSPFAQGEQRTIIAAMQRALDYAHEHGVTLVSALGNNHEDLGHPRTDTSSPDYPADAAYDRLVDNATCLDLPAEGNHVIGVSALGPSTKKSDFSNYGVEQISVAAPGGWFRDGFGTPTFRTNENMILSTYPKKVLQEEGQVDEDGNVTPLGVKAGTQKVCDALGRCGYYTYLQGTSMAAPHASGVAALIVSEHGKRDRAHRGGLTLDPAETEQILLDSAAEHACPTPRLQAYTNEGRSEEFNALCEGGRSFNGFYGHGIVDAYAAVTG
jgi:subtilisin family serine protease